MSYMNEEKIDLIDLKETSSRLCKSSRQVRRYVTGGLLNASGGGKGVPYTFKKADVNNFKIQLSSGNFRQHKEWTGVVNAKILARMVHGLKLRRDGSAKNDHFLQGFDMLWKLNQKTRAGIIRNHLPPLDEVPQNITKWTQQLEDSLAKRELDYVAAMFVVREVVFKKFDEFEEAARSKAIDILKETQPHFFRTKSTLEQSEEEWNAIKDSIKSKYINYSHDLQKIQMEFQQDLFLKEDKERAWRIYSENHPLMSIVEPLLIIVQSGNVDGLLNLLRNDTARNTDIHERYALYAGISEIKKYLVALTKKNKAVREYSDRAPSNRQVARALGMHHEQGMRIISSIVQKLHENDIGQLFEMLGLIDSAKIPRAWRGKSKATRKTPAIKQITTERCPHCAANITESMEECPECGRMI